MIRITQALAWSADGITHTMVAIIQPATMLLENIEKGSFSITFSPIATKASFTSGENIGRCRKVKAAMPAPSTLPANTTPHNRIRLPRLPRVGWLMNGSTAVTVFSVNSCWRARITIRKPRV